MMTRMRRLAQAAVGALLLLSVAPSGSSAAPRDRDNARVFVPEEQAGDELHMLLQQLEMLGIHRFVPPESQSAKPWELLRTTSSEFDLVWTTNGPPPYAELRFPSDFLAKVNHFPGSELLTSPDQLESLMRSSRKKHGNFHYSYVPRRFMLGQKDADNAQVEALIAELSRQHTHFRYLLRVPPAKPDAPHSSGIKIREVAKLREAMGSQFKGVAAVEAIEYSGPYLLEGNQFRAGFYVLVTSLDPIRIYIHSNVDIRVTKAGYPASESINWERPTEFMPLWDFAPFQPEFTEFPSAEREGSNAWRIVKRYMMIRGIDTNLLQREINAAVIKTLLASRSQLQEQISKLKREKKSDEAPPSDLSQSFFELWKFDFEIDHTGKPWLHKVHANPSLAPASSAMATDEGLKKRLAFDVLNLIGVHPQAKQPFEKFFRPSDASFCHTKCQDKTRAWDSACWSCPGWFPPYVARTLFDAMQEYSRRGRFNLAFPDLDRDFSRFTSTPLSEHDHAWDRYLKSLSSAYAEHQDFPVNDRVITCVYREHCSDHGDCVNGRCRCDDGYEGSSCYVPQDPTRKRAAAAAATDASAATGETWKERMGHLWNAGPTAATKPPTADQIVASRFSASKLLLALLVLSGFLYVAHLLVLRYGAAFGTTSQDEPDAHKVN